MSDKSNLVTHYLCVFFGAVSGLSLNEWISLFMLLLGTATFAINWYYKHKHLALIERQHTL